MMMRFQEHRHARTLALAALGLLAPLVPAAAADPFPLKRGYYVRDVPCGKASFGTRSSYNGGTDFTFGHAECKLKILSQSGKTYRVRRDCTITRDDSQFSQIVELIVESATSYTEKSENDTIRSRYCPAHTLPD